MSVNPLKNVSLKECRRFLLKVGCQNKRTTGGHEHWTRSDLLRPITIQTHIDPVPERIMKQIIKALEIDRDEFLEIMKSL
ncbi:MAG: type II toxin-antitoxin system HicA family toxin [Chitinophagaceae bacterium]|nr:type II toxin-antitoxin system HicA family toxin [Chitinophagaceae bacterium]